MSDFKKEFSMAFEGDNARTAGEAELSEQFVWTAEFERLLERKNNIVLGARGSGKTALIRMLSHPILSKSSHQLAKEIIASQLYIGVYVPMKLEWVSGLKNKPWLNEEESEKFFQWRLNLATCTSFLATIRSCLDCYVDELDQRVIAEYDIVRRLSEEWLEEEFGTLDELASQLERVEFQKQRESLEMRFRGEEPSASKVGITFELELFSPLKRGISIVKERLNLSSSGCWFLCLDEAEFLSEAHHRILNSHLRTYSSDLYFKITTMPYHHHTLETNVDVPLDAGHDFDYIYIDQQDLDPSSYQRYLENFTREVFEKRIPNSLKSTGISLFYLLGKSPMLGDIENDWSDREGKMWSLLSKYANKATLRRAENKFGSDGFGDEISRKMQGMLLLRDEINRKKGNTELTIYSGEKVLIVCGEGNPRRLIKLFREIIRATKISQKDGDAIGFLPLKPKAQNAILSKVSGRTLYLSKVIPEIGDELFRLLECAGSFMKAELVEKELSTDTTSSISIDDIDEQSWSLIKGAVGEGLLYPNINRSRPNQLPVKTGVFRIAFILSPTFNLLPRKGKSVPMNRIYDSKKQMALYP